MEAQGKDNPVGDKHRVLVVDDDRALRCYTRQVLASVGIEVVEAADARTALAAAATTRFDAVLLDVRMPGMDGLTACAELRRRCDDPRLPIFMLTGQTDQETIDAAYRAGATDYAVKPLNGTVLKNRLASLIRERRLADDLDLSERHREVLLEAIPDTVLRLDHDGNILEARVASQHHGRWPLRVGSSLFDGLEPAVAAPMRAGVARLLDSGDAQQIVFAVSDPHGDLHLEARMVSGDADEVVVTLRDISDKVQAEAEARRLARFDTVTGLANRAEVFHELDRYVRDGASRGQHVVAIRLDLLGLDHLSLVAGLAHRDRVLAACARRLGDAVDVARGTLPDDVRHCLGRTGDQGFALLLGGVDTMAEIEAFGTALTRHLNRDCPYLDDEIALRIGLGMAVFPDHDEDGRHLLEKAELALRELNDERPLRWYAAETRERALRKANLVRSLKSAIDNGELSLAYQPKVDAHDGYLRGVEALVRWESRPWGAVSPSEFIPLAESHGLILPLGEQVLHLACMQSRAWADQGLGRIPVAVNFSGHQFGQRHLVRDLDDSMAIYGVPADGIEVELTESVAMGNSARVRDVLNELQELGINTAIDDFGTGFSSLSSLRDFTFNTLKIDRKFVSDLCGGSVNVAILDAIITLGHALGMRLVAEGVETEDQLEYLRDSGCDVIQGYLTGRPVSAESIAERVRAARGARLNVPPAAPAGHRAGSAASPGRHPFG